MRNAVDVDRVLREEECGFIKGRGCVDQIFTLRLIIEKCLSCQTPLVLSFIDYEQAFDSVDRRALAKVLSLYGIPDKYIKVISGMYENDTAAVKVGNEVSSWFCIKSEVKLGCVLSPFKRPKRLSTEFLIATKAIIIKQFVVTNSSKERPGKILTETPKNRFLIPIVTSKKFNFYADFKYISFIKFSLTYRKLRA